MHVIGIQQLVDNMTHKYTCTNIPTNHKVNMQHIDKDFSWDNNFVTQSSIPSIYKYTTCFLLIRFTPSEKVMNILVPKEVGIFKRNQNS